MLDQLRKPSKTRNWKKYFTIVLFGAICVVFVFFGIGPGQLGPMGAGGAAAIVGDRVISIQDYQNSYQRMENLYSQGLEGMPADRRQEFYSDIRARALESLIDQELLWQATLKSGVTVSEPEIQRFIRKIEGFQEKGRFSRDRYMNYMKYLRLTPAHFERQVSQEIAVGRVREYFTSAMGLGHIEKEKERLLKGTKLELEYLGLESLRTQLNPSSNDLQQFLKENSDLVKRRYEDNKAKYTKQESVRARHILFKAESPGDFKKAEEKAKSVRSEILKVGMEQFGSLAQKWSEDPGSKDNQGDLGFFSKGRMVKEFENVAFSLEPGKVSEPVRTQYGFHLILVEEKRPAEVRPLNEVEMEISRDLYGDKKFESLRSELAEALKTGERKRVDGLLDRNKLKWNKTEEFDLSSGYIPGLGRGGEVLKKVLAKPVKGRLVEEVVNEDGREMLVSIKNFREVPEEKAGANDFAYFSRSNEVMGGWKKSLQKEIRVERNDRLISVQ